MGSAVTHATESSPRRWTNELILILNREIDEYISRDYSGQAFPRLALILAFRDLFRSERTGGARAGWARLGRSGIAEPAGPKRERPAARCGRAPTATLRA